MSSLYPEEIDLLTDLLGYQQQSQDSAKLELPPSQYTHRRPVLARAAQLFATERAWCDSEIAAHHAAGDLADWLAFAQVYLDAHNLRTAAVNQWPLSAATAPGPGRPAPTAAPLDCEAARASVTRSLRLDTNWRTFELWPYFHQSNRCTWVLPDWLAPELDETEAGAAAGVSALHALQLRMLLLDADVQSRIDTLQCHATGVSTLVPLRTSGDGDCFSHAVFLALWGFSDQPSLLRHLMQLVYHPGNRTSRRLQVR
jgi:hypothetical protein